MSSAPTMPLDYGNGALQIGASTESERRSRVCSAAKEPKTVAWLEAQCGTSEVFYDIGANIGAYSLIAAHLGVSQVFAFEPMPANYEELSKNIVRNGFEKIITPIPCGLSAKTGLDTFSQSSFEAGSAYHGFGPIADHTGKHIEPCSAVLNCGFSLDDFIAVQHLPPPTLLKIDVDGAEFDILSGARGTLAHPALKSVLIECDESPEGTAYEIIALLCGAGFSATEKHHLFEGLHNYQFQRASDCCFHCPEKIPVTWSRHGTLIA